MAGNWDREGFRLAYVAAGGSVQSAHSYCSYLNRVNALVDGIRTATDLQDGDDLIRRAEALPTAAWGSARNRRDSLSALRKYVKLLPFHTLTPLITGVYENGSLDLAVDPDELAKLLVEAKSLAARYYKLTGKPLGMTGEIAEMEAAARLGFTLLPPRTPWYDATDPNTGRKVQIKGKAVDPLDPYHGMCSAMKCSDVFDDIVLVLLDRTTSEPLEIWRAPQANVAKRIAGLSSRRRQMSGILAVTQFKSVVGAEKVWTSSTPADDFYTRATHASPIPCSTSSGTRPFTSTAS